MVWSASQIYILNIKCDHSEQVTFDSVMIHLVSNQFASYGTCLPSLINTQHRHLDQSRYEIPAYIPTMYSIDKCLIIYS